MIDYNFADESSYLYNKEGTLVGIQPASRNGTFLPFAPGDQTHYTVIPNRGLLIENSVNELDPNNTQYKDGPLPLSLITRQVLDAAHASTSCTSYSAVVDIVHAALKALSDLNHIHPVRSTLTTLLDETAALIQQRIEELDITS